MANIAIFFFGGGGSKDVWYMEAGLVLFLESHNGDIDILWYFGIFVFFFVDHGFKFSSSKLQKKKIFLYRKSSTNFWTQKGFLSLLALVSKRWLGRSFLLSLHLQHLNQSVLGKSRTFIACWCVNRIPFYGRSRDGSRTATLRVPPFIFGTLFMD